MADVPDSATPLLEAYRRWKRLQDSPPGRSPAERAMTRDVAKAAADGHAATIAGLARLAEVERRAHQKGVRRVAKVSRAGASPTVALAAGYARYRRHGGSTSIAVWRRRVAAGGRT